MRARLAVGLLLAVAGLAAFALAFARSPTVEIRRDAGPAAVGPGAADPLDISANNSPTLARNPTDAANIVLANRVDLPRFGCGLHSSRDGGVTWTESAIPLPPGTEPKCYAPDAAFGADGTLFVSWVMLAGTGNTPDSLWVASSTDGGETLSAPVEVAGPLTFQVRIAADPAVADRLYLTWLQAEQTGNLALPETGNPIVVSRSDDGGRAWSAPVQVSDPSRERVLAATPDAGGDGALVVAYLDVRDDRLDYHGAHGGQGGPPHPGPWELVVARSADGGRTWAEATVDGGLVPIERFIVFLPAFPALAVDGDRVHVAFHDARLGDPDVWVWSSTDAGASWLDPVRVNDTVEGDGTSQYLPQLALAPGGRLDAVYYDRRADADDVMNEVSLQSSADEGETFSARVQLSDVAFDSRFGFGGGRDMAELGSRLALVSDDRGARAAWADTREGSLDWGEQHVYSTTVTVEEHGAAMEAALRWGGLGLAAAGALTVALALVRRGADAAGPALRGAREERASVSASGSRGPGASRRSR